MEEFVWPQYLVEPQYIEGYVEVIVIYFRMNIMDKVMYPQQGRHFVFRRTCLLKTSTYLDHRDVIKSEDDRLS